MTFHIYSRGLKIAAIALLPLMLASCMSFGASGPSTKSVLQAQKNDPHIVVLDATDAVARRIIAARSQVSMANRLGDGPAYGVIVGSGDILDIAVWEAPPAALFGGGSIDSRLSLVPSVSRVSEIPSQMVDGSGNVYVPFVGAVHASGRRPAEIAREIVSRLAGKAHQPQVVVRIAENQAATVTVVGDVVNSKRVPLTPKGERLLDVLASAGGVRQAVDKVMIQVTRGDQVVAQPLGAIIRNPSENVHLRPNDVVTALYQPYSFSALGAVGNNAEINFEGTGLTLAQALGRIGGLQDQRANVKGVFIFRLEDAAALSSEHYDASQVTPDGKVPVIYRVDMSNPATFFVAQGFPIHDKDVIYVSNSPIADLQKFINVISQLAFSVAGVVGTIP